MTGKSATTIDRNVGAAAVAPDDGPAKIALAACVARLIAKVPLSVIAAGETAKSVDGTVIPILVTDPEPVVAHCNGTTPVLGSSAA